nr:MAG TPA: hypothetical protein [Caudoviricetes sp.]
MLSLRHFTRFGIPRMTIRELLGCLLTALRHTLIVCINQRSSVGR